MTTFSLPELLRKEVIYTCKITFGVSEVEIGSIIPGCKNGSCLHKGVDQEIGSKHPCMENIGFGFRKRGFSYNSLVTNFQNDSLKAAVSLKKQNQPNKTPIPNQ